MGRHIAANALTLMIVGLVLLGGFLGWAQQQFTSEGPLETAMCLRVERGANIAAVSRALESEGAIANGTIFRVGANYTEKSERLRFGSYLIQPRSSMQEILDVVTRGGASTCGTEVNFRIGVLTAETVVRELDPTTNRYVEKLSFDWEADAPEEYAAVATQADTRFRVTVAEGSTVWQVAEGLRRAPFLDGEIGELPPEGSLAPESYEVRPGADRAELLAEMGARQARILEELWQGRADDLPLASPQEALILASIVEKETGVADERRQVASVFVNRLRIPMRLQTDPTVIYGITLGRGALGRGLRQSELRGATPYNTYVIDGLPPTPIANPGRASIAAALNPDETRYLYFVADGSGGHAFATNLADHNTNVAQWRRIEAERRSQ